MKCNKRLSRLLQPGARCSAVDAHVALAEMVSIGDSAAVKRMLCVRPHLLSDDLCVPLSRVALSVLSAARPYLAKMVQGDAEPFAAMSSAVHLMVPELGGSSVQLTPEAERHAKARRVALGEEIVLFDGAGNCATAELQRHGLAVVRERWFVPPPRRRIVVATAVPKNDRLETLVVRKRGAWFDV